MIEMSRQVTFAVGESDRWHIFGSSVSNMLMTGSYGASCAGSLVSEHAQRQLQKKRLPLQCPSKWSYPPIAAHTNRKRRESNTRGVVRG